MLKRALKLAMKFLAWLMEVSSALSSTNPVERKVISNTQQEQLQHLCECAQAAYILELYSYRLISVVPRPIYV